MEWTQKALAVRDRTGGLTQRRLRKRPKSASLEHRSASCSMAKVASRASVVRFTAVPRS